MLKISKGFHIYYVLQNQKSVFYKKEQYVVLSAFHQFFCHRTGGGSHLSYVGAFAQ
jgi:hypothetical protein